jgi:hypothetical protein
MKKLTLALVAASAAFGAAPAVAAPIFAPVPTANYITFGGNDWAWAAPCAPSQPSCGVIDLTFQGPLGWRVATASDFANGPTAADFGTPSNFACASAWFSTTHTHCDYSDGVSLAIFNHPGNPFPGNSNVDTWVIRDGMGAVPEPSAWALLIIGFGMVGAGLRLRKPIRAFAA